ncbi:MAG: DUF3892 domain-containing protein [Mucilaginibacter sp.]|uniref:DUF3892 domain-containing protein n=1 Tax=Mucilaginibacter sp. TaxID=1882438 RepID=UPI0031B3905D
MATRKQISCINKRGDHYDPHERIQYIGGVYAGSRWRLAEDIAIFNIRYQLEEYFVMVGGRSVDVLIAVHNGREYLKTRDDGYAPNNLLSLPECPSF